jgi:hypothetical protein
MAKIALFCENFHETTRDLARALHSLRHEVILVTSREVEHTEDLPFTVLTYFKSWSALEGIKFIPRFISHAPEVWYFCFPEPRRHPPKGAHVMLAAVAQGLPRRIVMASFFSVLPRASVALRGLLPLCKVVTFGAREDLMNAKRKGLPNKEALLEVFPPLPRREHQGQENLKEDYLRLIETLRPYIFVWSEDPPSELIDAAVNANLKLLARGPRNLHKDQKNVWFLPEGLSQNQIRFAAHQAQGIALHTSDLDLSELHRMYEFSQSGKVPLFVSARQAEALPGLCVHQRTGWVVNKPTDIRKLFASSEFQNFRYQAGPQSNFSITDSAINDLNRLMTKALVQSSRQTKA